MPTARIPPGRHRCNASNRVLQLEVIALEHAHPVRVVISPVTEEFLDQFGFAPESALLVNVDRRRIRRINDQVELAQIQHLECIRNRETRRLARIAPPLTLRRDDDLELT